jgi:hypothetical protein
VRTATAVVNPPMYSPSSGILFTVYREYTTEEVRCVLVQSPPKTCMLEPMPTDVLLELIDITLPHISTMCNASLIEGILLVRQKAAIVTPIVKKAGLSVDDEKSYRLISNLTFISKVIARIVAEQKKSFLTESDH